MNYKRTPLLRLVIPFILGVILFKTFDANVLWLFVLTVIVTVLLMLIFFLKSYSWRWLFGVVSSLTFLLLGGLFIHVQLPENNATHYSHAIVQNEEHLMMIHLSSKQKGNISYDKWEADINAVRINKKWRSRTGRILVNFKRDTLGGKFNVGDIVLINTTLRTFRGPANPGDFDYRSYMNNKSVYHQAFVWEDDRVILNRKMTMFGWFKSIRTDIINTLSDNLLNDELAIASALILGYKNDISKELKQDYSKVGAMHILAVSGLHIGVVYLLIEWLLKLLKWLHHNRWIKLLLILLCLWGYALLTGMSPSVVRAGLMFSLMAIANTFYRKNSTFNSIAASALLILVVDPLLVFNVGFQLSYIAVMGIILFQPIVSECFSFRWKVIQKIGELISVAIAAQLITLPIGLYYFHCL